MSLLLVLIVQLTLLLYTNLVTVIFVKWGDLKSSNKRVKNRSNKLYPSPTNQYESDSSMTNKVHDTNVMHLVFLDLKKVGNLSLLTFRHMKQLTPLNSF